MKKLSDLSTKKLQRELLCRAIAKTRTAIAENCLKCCARLDKMRNELLLHSSGLEDCGWCQTR